MSEFLSMGGYALYVWPSFLLTVAFLVIGILQPWQAHRQARARIAAGADR